MFLNKSLPPQLSTTHNFYSQNTHPSLSRSSPPAACFLPVCVHNNTMNNHTMKLLVLLFSIVHFIIAQRPVDEPRSLTGDGLRPTGETEYRVIEVEEDDKRVVSLGRRRLAPYELCLLCKCCAGNTTCITMPCCFGIDCHLPNKPFGVCAFVPKTCNCASCAAA